MKFVPISHSRTIWVQPGDEISPAKWQFCTIKMQHIICIWCRIRSCLHYIVMSILTDNVVQVGSLCLCHIGCTEWLMDSRQNTKPEWGDINQQRCSWHHHYRCYAMLLFTVLTHETARYGEIASAIWNFSFAAWKWVNMDGNWRNFDVNISSYV